MFAEMYTNMEVGKRYINFIPFNNFKSNTVITVVDVTMSGIEYIYTRSKSNKIYRLSFKNTKYFKEYEED